MSVATPERTLSSAASIPALPLRLALIGCGAIAEQFHLPVLGGHENLNLVALVDRDAARRDRLAASYGVQYSFADQGELDFDLCDAAILATPPAHHAPGAIDLMRRGVHVLVEKPMALNLEQAERMCQVAEQNRVVLAVGVYRRLLPAVQFMRGLLRRRQFGRVLHCEADWGGIGGYGSATLGLMQKATAGGGVLMDLGPHLLDILVEWFGVSGAVTEYHDDACGGIEADCEARIHFEQEDAAFEAIVRLSRVRKLASGFRVHCEQAICELDVTERFEVRIRPNNGTPPFMMRPESAQLSASWFEPFRAEIDDWLDAIQHRNQPSLSGRSCLPAMHLIEQCYQQRRPLRRPWLDPKAFAAGERIRLTPRPRVLITGGGGFIGGRTAHLLAQDGTWNVRAHVRRPATASQLARLPIEIVHGDLRYEEDVARIVSECDAVVHCAVGTDYGQKRSIYEVTVDGTRRLLEAARQAGVKRFVHLSSIGVHDPESHDVIDASTPLHRSKSDWYGYTKGLAEQAVIQAGRQGLATVVLRPGCVYGPYGFTFVMNPLQALVEGRLVLVDAADTPSNSVFVDNVVEAIRLALVGEERRVAGQVAVIGDEENWTWEEYYDFFAERLGLTVQKVSIHGASSQKQPRKSTSRSLASALASSESKQFAKRLLHSDPVGSAPRWMLARFPQTELWLRRCLKLDRPEIYERGVVHRGSEVRITPRRARISNEGAKATLGYQAAVGRVAAMEQTYHWACYAGILPAESSAEPATPGVVSRLP